MGIDQFIERVREGHSYQGETPVGNQCGAYYVLPADFLPVPYFAGCVTGTYGTLAILSEEIPSMFWQFVAAHELACARMLRIPGILDATPQEQFHEMWLIHSGPLTDGQRAFTENRLMPMCPALAEHLGERGFGRQILRAIDISRMMFRFRLGDIAIAA